MTDRRALQILHRTFWSSAGWRDKPSIAPADLAYCKAHGVMFDPVSGDHDDALARLLAVIPRVSAQLVVDAFLASLSTRRVHLRSAFGSYFVFRHLVSHPAPPPKTRCVVCGGYATAAPHDLNILSFERFKWGGVRHLDPSYAAFDLERLLADEPPRFCTADVAILRSILEALRAAPPRTRGSNAHKLLRPLLRSNKDECDTLVSLLGFAGVLRTGEHPSFWSQFVDVPRRKEDSSDMSYPACWWRVANGLDEDVIEHLFGAALA